MIPQYEVSFIVNLVCMMMDGGVQEGRPVTREGNGEMLQGVRPGA